MLQPAKRIFFSAFFGLSLLWLLISPIAWAAPDTTAAKTKPAAASAGATEEDSPDHALPMKDVRRFTATISHIKNYYVEPVTDQALFESAIRGMLEGLDPHSNYLNEEDFAELRSSTSGEFGGVGLEITGEDGEIKVVSAIDDTPAASGGIKSGDLILRINNVPTRNMSLRDAVKKMRGPKGSKIQLTLARAGQKEPIVVNLTRDVIHVASVKSRMLSPGYGYLRISVFQMTTGAELLKALKKLEADSGGKLKGLVLDLRNNPGGLLDSAIDVADTFLDSNKMGSNKLIVYTKGRIPSAQIKANATAVDYLNGVPLVVLINEGSASASEIVAGALQDQKRAVLIGKKTFGKGSVQTILPLDDKTAIKLTTARYYTPSGRSIQAEGIVPDIMVNDIIIPKDKQNDKAVIDSVKESDLSGHLKNETSEDDTASDGDADQPKDAEGKPLIYSDYQLYQAYDILRGLSFLYQAEHPAAVLSAKKAPSEDQAQRPAVKE